MSAANPFRAGMLMEHPADPCVLVIFGGTGDLAQRKLFPSLAHLVREGRMSEQTQFLCVTRKELDQAAFRAEVIDNARKLAPDSIPDDDFARNFGERIFLVTDNGDGGRFDKLRWRLGEMAGAGGPRNHLIDLLIPPTAYAPTIAALGAVGLAAPDRGAWSRMIIEPFGRDLASAATLNAAAADVFREEQIYRIDHYLGKDGAEHSCCVWPTRSSSRFGIITTWITSPSPPPKRWASKERAQYYEESGALRDMIQNHLCKSLP